MDFNCIRIHVRFWCQWLVTRFAFHWKQFSLSRIPSLMAVGVFWRFFYVSAFINLLRIQFIFKTTRYCRGIFPSRKFWYTNLICGFIWIMFSEIWRITWATGLFSNHSHTSLVSCTVYFNVAHSIMIQTVICNCFFDKIIARICWWLGIAIVINRSTTCITDTSLDIHWFSPV